MGDEHHVRSQAIRALGLALAEQNVPSAEAEQRFGQLKGLIALATSGYQTSDTPLDMHLHQTLSLVRGPTGDAAATTCVLAASRYSPRHATPRRCCSAAHTHIDVCIDCVHGMPRLAPHPPRQPSCPLAALALADRPPKTTRFASDRRLDAWKRIPLAIRAASLPRSSMCTASVAAPSPHAA